MKRILLAGFFILSISIVVFPLRGPVHSSARSIVITEVAASAKSGEEWVEIMNVSDESIDMTGWVFWEAETNHRLTPLTTSFLEPGQIALIAQDGDWAAATHEGTIIFDSSWGSLRESGEEIGIKDDSGEIVELLTYPSAPDHPTERTDYDHVASAYWVSAGTPGVWEYQPVSDPETVIIASPTYELTLFLPAPISGEPEWVEITNTGGDALVSADIVLFDEVGELARTTTALLAGQVLRMSWSGSKLNNSGDTVRLAVDGVDVASYAYESSHVVAGEVIAVHVPEAAAQSPNSQHVVASTTPTYRPGDIVINEFVSDPADGAVEFVELFNTTDDPISLEGWWIEDGSETKTGLAGSIGTRHFFLREEIKGNLNNRGDEITLYSPDGQIIDQIRYGDWASADMPAPADPHALARIRDGQDTNRGVDFAVTEIITPGATNQIHDPFVVVKENVEKYQALQITEVLPDPEGDDAEGEYVEIYNSGRTTVPLEGVVLRDGSSKKYELSGQLRAGQRRAVFRHDSSIVLNNSGGDRVRLETTNGALIDEVTYAKSKPAEAYAFLDGRWQWTRQPTPGQENMLLEENHAPDVVLDARTQAQVGEPVVFDASDSSDEDGDEMLFIWGASTGTPNAVHERSFAAPGVYTVTLTVVDSHGASSDAEHIVTVVEDTVAHEEEALVLDYVSHLRLSELLPNPVGSDSAEYIELYNPTNSTVDLSGLKLDDAEGGSRAYAIPENTLIEPGSYMVFGKQVTKIALNNTADSARLLRKDNSIIDETSYGAALEGASYAALDDEWQWTSHQTPGEQNAAAPLAVLGAKTVRKGSQHAPVFETDLGDLRQFDPGDRVKVTGSVTVEAGLLGKQIMYIAGERGVQVYSHKATFPNVSVGDRVSVTGELSEAYGETRLKLAGAGDMIHLDHPGQPVAEQIDIVDIEEAYEGSLIQIHGEVTEQKTHYIYVDDGTAEVQVYAKRTTGVAPSLYNVGDLVTVTGIVSERRGEYRLLPRYERDIEKTGEAKVPDVLKEKHTAERRLDDVRGYLLATAGALTAVLLGVMLRWWLERRRS